MLFFNKKVDADDFASLINTAHNAGFIDNSAKVVKQQMCGKFLYCKSNIDNRRIK